VQMQAEQIRTKAGAEFAARHALFKGAEENK
jgi:hypothetical protein